MMAGHSLKITFRSGNDIAEIMVDEEGVETLMPGTPPETVQQALTLVSNAVNGLINSKSQEIKEKFVTDHITISN